MFGEEHAHPACAPSYFPFTEPSMETDFLCFVCHGDGRDPSRAAPAAARAGSSSAAPAWSTARCCAPAASTPTSTPGSRSGWASSARCMLRHGVQGHARHRRGRRPVLRSSSGWRSECAHRCRWLAEYTDLAPGATGADVAASARLASASRRRTLHGGDITGPLVVGRVLVRRASRRRTARRSAGAPSTSASTARC